MIGRTTKRLLIVALLLEVWAAISAGVFYLSPEGHDVSMTGKCFASAALGALATLAVMLIGSAIWQLSDEVLRWIEGEK